MKEFILDNSQMLELSLSFLIVICYYRNDCIFFAVVPNPGHLNYFTCMSYGPYYYRTFDGLEFLYGGRCSYTLFTDGARTVEVNMNKCTGYKDCTKVSPNIEYTFKALEI